MSHTPNDLKKTWQYEYDGNTHNDRIGRILAQGVDLRTTFKAQALATVKKANQLEKEEKQGSRGSANAHFLNQTSSSEQPKADGRGMVWVDEAGNTLGPASTQSFQEEMKHATGLEGLNEKQVAMTTLTPVERSVHMWRKVQPGCMKSTTKVPESTMKDHFVYDAKAVHPVNWKTHYVKSDFSEYVENKIKVGNAIT